MSKGRCACICSEWPDPCSQSDINSLSALLVDTTCDLQEDAETGPRIREWEVWLFPAAGCNIQTFLALPGYVIARCLSSATQSVVAACS